jgi:hypothetical protein
MHSSGVRLTPEHYITVVAFAEHAIDCEVGLTCSSCITHKVAVRSAFADAAEQALQARATMVEGALGGGDDDRRPRKCIGMNCECKTILRCPVCMQPCCKLCVKSTLHPHTVRVRSDVRLTYDIDAWSYYNEKGKKVKTHTAYADKATGLELAVQPVPPEYPEHMHSYYASSAMDRLKYDAEFTVFRKMLKDNGWEQKQCDDKGIVREYTAKKIGEKPITYFGRKLVAGQVFDLPADMYAAGKKWLEIVQ